MGETFPTQERGRGGILRPAARDEQMGRSIERFFKRESAFVNQNCLSLRRVSSQAIVVHADSIPHPFRQDEIHRVQVQAHVVTS